MAGFTWFITMTTYGTWLPGDPRGSTWKGRRQEVARPYLQRRAQRLLRHAPMTFSLVQRQVALESILETCRYRDWRCVAANVRTAHVHGILDGPKDGDQAAVALKGNITRVLRERGLLGVGIESVWTEGQDVSRVRPERVERACRYVLEEQGPNVDGTWFDCRQPDFVDDDEAAIASPEVTPALSPDACVLVADGDPSG